ncbi:hypothetical protein CONPUDRAFT_169763 [Coniophora puteana RWD-64-598 SS2]|uniref:Transmembrane protein n=1 Tax=Coniophora puteana (strain RWD-64-598) TaxID=741705 RepID=A0A5M3M6X3_CONPW|nr:uncharacterized protein CONPUDRAFT_169763 [Coniophora puteana RWD-64-598 SS2]EIW74813.1 hypothetical protein CONPUDRAFT_169763 [Coniophora puteana RWD-64-598 SS2]
MPKLTTFFDDRVPMITFDSGWIPTISTQDDAAGYYWDGTFTSTPTDNATAQLTFTGTSVWVYGSKRVNHGTFTVEIDGTGATTVNGYSPMSQWQQLLYSNSGLSQGQHTIVITNTGNVSTGSWLDFDMIKFETTVGDDSGSWLTSVIQDTDSAFVYSGSWNGDAEPSNAAFFSQGSGHTTTETNDQVTLTFTVGDVIDLYGTVGPSNGQYSVQLDGGSIQHFNATKPLPQYQMVIYHESNLGSGNHQLVVTNMDPMELSIDYAEVKTASTSSGEFGLCKTSLTPGIAAGLAILAFTTLVGLLSGAYFFRRWRKEEVDAYRNAAKPFDLMPAPHKIFPYDPYEPHSAAITSGHYSDIPSLSYNANESNSHSEPRPSFAQTHSGPASPPWSGGQQNMYSAPTYVATSEVATAGGSQYGGRRDDLAGADDQSAADAPLLPLAPNRRADSGPSGSQGQAQRKQSGFAEQARRAVTTARKMSLVRVGPPPDYNYTQ